MNARITIMVLALLTFGIASAHAAEIPALAKSKNCMTCHTIDKKIVGPAWKDVAAKYRGNASAEATLVAKLKSGGGGVWSPVPMPPNNLTDAEAQELVKFILSLQ